MRAIAAVEPGPEFLRARLDDSSAAVRAVATVRLAADGKLTSADADRRLAALATDASPATRAALARAIAECPSPRFERTLLELSEDRDSDVLAEVAIAMGRLSRPAFLPVLMRLLENREIVPAAGEALAALGRPALDALVEAAHGPSTSQQLRWNIPGAIARFDPRQAAPILLDLMLDGPEGVVRYRSLRALGRLRALDPNVPIHEASLLRAADRAIQSAFRNLEARLILERGAAHDPALATPVQELLRGLLRDKELAARERLFRVLGLLHPGERFDRIHRGLSSENSKARASSRELCENLVTPRLREPVLGLIEELSDEERLARAEPHYRCGNLDYRSQLRALAGASVELAVLARHHLQEIENSAHRIPESAPIAAETPLRAAVLQSRERPEALRELDLRAADLSAMDLSGATLSDLNLDGAVLRDARLLEANLKGAVLRNADLSGADLSGADLSGADLRGAILERARFNDARLDGTRFAGAFGIAATFNRCSGTGTQFAGGKWDTADFGHCRLERADFSGALLVDARFAHAKLSGLLLSSASVRGTSFDAAELGAADLRQTQFRRCTFDRATLREARVKSAQFTACSLRDANLERADLRGASFQGCDVTGVLLNGADTRGSDLSETSAPSVASALKEALHAG